MTWRWRETSARPYVEEILPYPTTWGVGIAGAGHSTWSAPGPQGRGGAQVQGRVQGPGGAQGQGLGAAGPFASSVFFPPPAAAAAAGVGASYAGGGGRGLTLTCFSAQLPAAFLILTIL